MVYTVTFNPALDYVLKTNSLNAGTINRALGDTIYYGGKGINVSAILSRLGIDNKALGFIAGFTGAELEKMLTDDGIKCDFIPLPKGRTRINVKIKSTSETDINAKGPEITKDDIECLIKKLESSVSDNDYIVLSGSIPENLPSDTYGKILKCLTVKNIKAIIDASGELLLNTLKYKPFLIKPNHIELGELFGTDITSDDDAIKYAKELQKLGAKNVLVSLGEKGAILVTEIGVFKAENADGILINSTGCGDSMIAGFLAGIIQKND